MEGNGKTAIEVHQAASSAVYEPRNFDEAMRLAVTYAKSNLLGEIRSPEAALLVMATGSELGIPATAALRGIFCVKGKPFLSADLMVAVCLKRGDICEFFTCVESTAERATYETKRKGAPAAVRNTFTIEDAKAAGLLQNDTYRKWPKDMLRHRASAGLARMVYPDLTLGLYCMEEQDAVIEEANRGPNVIDAHFEVQPPQPLTPVPTKPFPATPPPVQATLPTQQPAPPAAEQAPPPPKDEEPLESCHERWVHALGAAQTVADADKVRREVKKRLAENEPMYLEMVERYKQTVQRLRNPNKGTAPEDIIT